MRVGELTDGDHPIKVTDVHLCKEKRQALLILRSSKTHSLYERPQKIEIKMSEVHKEGVSFFDPFELLYQYSELREQYTEEERNFFVFRDSSPVKPRHFRNVLRETLRNLQLDATLYHTHSFRIGRATDLCKFGYTVDQIKYVGRWKSNAVYKYLR